MAPCTHLLWICVCAVQAAGATTPCDSSECIRIHCQWQRLRLFHIFHFQIFSRASFICFIYSFSSFRCFVVQVSCIGFQLHSSFVCMLCFHAWRCCIVSIGWTVCHGLHLVSSTFGFPVVALCHMVDILFFMSWFICKQIAVCCSSKLVPLTTMEIWLHCWRWCFFPFEDAVFFSPDVTCLHRLYCALSPSW